MPGERPTTSPLPALAPPGVHVLELQPPAFVRPHFVAYSFWAGAHHHVWAVESSSPSVHAA